ncbi:MAG: sugar transferase [Planctomycetota bacterium]
MLREHRIFVRRALSYLDLVCAFAAYVASIETRRALDVEGHTFVVNEWTHLVLGSTAFVVLWLSYRLSGIYQSQRLSRYRGEAARIVACNALTFVILLALAFGLDLDASNRLQIGFFSTFSTLATLILHFVIRRGSRGARRLGFNTRNLLIVSPTGLEVGELAERVKQEAWWGFRVVGVVLPPAVLESGSAERGLRRAGVSVDVPRVEIEQAAALLDRRPVDEIWIDGWSGPESPIHELTEQTMARGITVRHILARATAPGQRWRVDSLGHMTTLSATRTPTDELALALKRAIDLAVAVLVLAVVAPLLALVALALLLERNGPVLFRQERVGRNGRRFVLYKFRSMVPNAERLRAALAEHNEMRGPAFKLTNDPRVTPLGRWLRRLSIDELPQLFNVIKGEMSLVGPRPPLPSEVDLYQPSQRRRLSVRPGITGLWQVRGRSDIQDFERWVKLDLEYIDHWSLASDLWILVRTIPAVLTARGAR